jgi:hypothetical protein
MEAQVDAFARGLLPLPRCDPAWLAASVHRSARTRSTTKLRNQQT